jgi:hypothetical protein
MIGARTLHERSLSRRRITDEFQLFNAAAAARTAKLRSLGNLTGVLLLQAHQSVHAFAATGY